VTAIRLVARDAAGNSFGSAAPVRRGRRSGEFRIELWEPDGSALSRYYVVGFCEAVAEVKFHGAVTIECDNPVTAERVQRLMVDSP
jgi:hypothetical protein